MKSLRIVAGLIAALLLSVGIASPAAASVVRSPAHPFVVHRLRCLPGHTSGAGYHQTNLMCHFRYFRLPSGTFSL